MCTVFLTEAFPKISHSVLPSTEGTVLWGRKINDLLIICVFWYLKNASYYSTESEKNQRYFQMSCFVYGDPIRSEGLQ